VIDGKRLLFSAGKHLKAFEMATIHANDARPRTSRVYTL